MREYTPQGNRQSVEYFANGKANLIEVFNTIVGLIIGDGAGGAADGKLAITLKKKIGNTSNEQ